MLAGNDGFRGESPPPAPPVRDSSTIRAVKYGPGHEKFPSWPVPAKADAPPALRAPPSGGSHRSKSWTDHTNYPKEKLVAYTRPFMKRHHSAAHTQQKLKTVMEKCEKIPPETFESRFDKRFFPTVNHDGKSIGDADYAVPSPPERDLSGKPQLTQADLEEYARSYQESTLEEFMDYNYEDSLFGQKQESLILHQKQVSYAQSEGYHSYVSSADSSSTPFLDRLRRDSEAARAQGHWETAEEHEGRDSVVTTSSGSASSSETLKWHGSMSDVSVASSSCTHLSSRQLIAHSARVQTPQRHHSESVLYIGKQDGWKDKENRNNSANKLKLFPLNTYTVQEEGAAASANRLSLSMQSSLSVADRISELEKHRYSYLDPNKKHKVPDPTLKAIQKKALLSFYERHHGTKNGSWRSEPHLAPMLPAPPPKAKILPSRRASSASDYASGSNSKRSSLASSLDKEKILPKHQHSNSCSNDLLGPVIVGPAISIDDYVPDQPPARPPKHPHLRTAFPDLFQEQRVPSPDLPPPSPPTITDEVITNDDPLPPPPPEIINGAQQASPQVRKLSRSDSVSMKQTLGIPERTGKYASVRSNVKTKSSEMIIQHVNQTGGKKMEVLGFPNLRGYAERSSTRYPKEKMVAVSQKVTVADQFRPEPLRAQQKRQRASLAAEEGSPPPLQPRQFRLNQSMRARVPLDHKGVGKGKDGLKDKEKSPSLHSSLRSQSKASYLASRRDRDRIVPDSETGSYKRTMSPNGHVPQISERINSSREAIWPLKPNKQDFIKNNTILRKPSMSEKRKEEDKEIKKPLALPDVLPINVKLGPRSPQFNRPTHLSLSPLENPEIDFKKSPSSPKSTSSPKIKPSLSPNSKFSPIRTGSPKTPPESPKKEEVPKVVEGLQLIQRTEVTLRVNAATSDASSQTEKVEVSTPLPTRRKLQEEIECEKLSQDFVNHLSTSDRLKELLVPGPEHKKPSDYVQGLFKTEVTSRVRPANSPFRSRNNTPSSSPPPSNKLSLSPSVIPSLEPLSPLSGSSVYFTTSEPKAKFLTRFSQDMSHCHIVRNTKDLNQKKEELVNRLDRKLEVLRSEQLVVSEECKINDELGENVENHINRLARPHEISKFRLHIEEVGKITSLLLGLSGRLARAENALLGMSDDDPEKSIFEAKRDKLLDQLEEAKKLKECIDRRSVSVSNILYKYLNSEEYADYDHFINMKAKLIMDSKEISDKIKLGEEQLAALRETLILTD